MEYQTDNTPGGLLIRRLVQEIEDDKRALKQTPWRKFWLRGYYTGSIAASQWAIGEVRSVIESGDTREPNEMPHHWLRMGKMSRGGFV